MMTESVIIAGARTPIGKFLGGFAEITPQTLGGHAIAAALERSGVPASDIQYVIMGQVLQAGQGQITARQAAKAAGVPMDVPAITINKVCLSGLNAVALADQLIRAGEVEVVVAGGMESMTGAPYILPGARSGMKMGDSTTVDLMIRDGLWCAFEDRHMGAGSDEAAASLGISREAQDEWAAMSHERAAEATKKGRFALEIACVPVPQRKGDPVIIEEDEGIRPGTTVESLSKLRPAFTPTGTITAGNASQLSDGAAALIVTSKQYAQDHGLQILATIVGYGMVAGPDASLESQPAHAIRKVSDRIGVDPSAYDIYEMNEAFATVAIQSAKELGLGPDKVNVNGGAIALGHPIGATGARLVLTTALELQSRGGGLGVAALCGGGGQGDSLVLRVG